MSVRAKFICNSITHTKHWDKNKGLVATIKLNPVNGSNDENKAFFDATPSGEISLGIIKEEVAKKFEIGAEYYIDFTKAE